VDSPEEEPLDGGNLAHVVRVGDTVRRPSGHWTPTIHALLSHLAAKGFDAAPRAQGVDERGREVLSFVPGRAVGAQRPFPAWVWSDETLAATGTLLRRYHEAVRDFEPPEGERWRLTDARKSPFEIICHNDVAPYNLVLREDGTLALIDWDVASPGTPAFDLAFAACAFAPMHEDDHCRALGADPGPRRLARLRLLLDSYGLEDRTGFVSLMRTRLTASIDRIRGAAEGGDAAFQALIARGLLEPVEASRALIARRADELEAAIR
jgi:hypothetical protein